MLLVLNKPLIQCGVEEAIACGNCGLICWEKREDREENRRILMNSGVVVLTAEGKRMAVPAEETTELDTPYGVKVAMLRREARALPELANLLKEGALTTVLPEIPRF
jgi:hypothetical protein